MEWKKQTSWLLILVFFFAFFIPTKANTPIKVRTHNSVVWEKVTEGKNYPSIEYEKEEPEEEEKEKKEQKEPSSNTNLGKYFKYIALAIGIIIILLILIKVFQNTTIERTDTRTNFEALLDEIEEDLHEHELQPLLNQALTQHDYKAAIRIQFLMIIQDLNTFEVIKWKKRKTNQNYFDEITNKAIQKRFGNCKLIYEKAWFGAISIDREKYNQLDPVLNNLRSEIETTYSVKNENQEDERAE